MMPRNYGLGVKRESGQVAEKRYWHDQARNSFLFKLIQTT